MAAERETCDYSDGTRNCYARDGRAARPGGGLGPRPKCGISRLKDSGHWGGCRGQSAARRGTCRPDRARRPVRVWRLDAMPPSDFTPVFANGYPQRSACPCTAQPVAPDGLPVHARLVCVRTGQRGEPFRQVAS